jgi:hypothetical protein
MPTKKKVQQRPPAAKANKALRPRDVARETGTGKSKARPARSSRALTAPSVVSVTPAEHAVITGMHARGESRCAPSVKNVTMEGKRQLTFDHRDQWVGSRLLMNALGTTSVNFLGG